MARRDVRMNIHGLREVLRSEGMQQVLRDAAEPIAARARATAPVDSGEYRDSIHVETEVHRYVAVARVVASDRKAPIIEAKTGNLARAL